MKDCISPADLAAGRADPIAFCKFQPDIVHSDLFRACGSISTLNQEIQAILVRCNSGEHARDNETWNLNAMLKYYSLQVALLHIMTLATCVDAESRLSSFDRDVIFCRLLATIGKSESIDTRTRW